MAALIVGLAVMAVMMTVAMPVWKQTVQREKEEEMVFRGEQIARSIGLFQRKFANAYPPTLDLLVEQKFLRKKYKDPITNDDFVPLTQAQQGAATPGATPGTSRGGATQAQPNSPNPAGGRGNTNPFTQGSGTLGAAPGGIIGVTSKSNAVSIRLYKGRSHYNEWAFVYTAPARGGPGGPGGAGGPGGPGGPVSPGGPNRGGPGGPVGPNGPNGPGRTGGPGGTGFPGGRGPAPGGAAPFPFPTGPGRGR